MRLIAFFLGVLLFAGMSFSVGVTGCQLINSANIYTLSNNLSGANISLAGSPVCIGISASNVILDCNNFNITNNGTASAYGVYVNGPVLNVTVRNCPGISLYNYGIFLYQANNSVILNDTVFNVSGTYGEGIESSNGYYDLLANDTVHDFNTTGCGAMDIFYGGYSNITGSTVYYSNVGIGLDSTLDSIVFNSTAHDVPFECMEEAGTTSSNFTFSTAYNCESGFYIVNGQGIILQSDIARTSSQPFYLTNTMSDWLDNDTASGGSDAFDLASVNSTNLTNDNAHDNSAVGFSVRAGSVANILNGDNATNDSFGFYMVQSSTNNILTNDLANNPSVAGAGFKTDAICYNTFVNDTAFNMSTGFSIGSSSNNFTNVTAYNSYTGFSFNPVGGVLNQISNFTADGNTYGMEIYNTSTTNLSGGHFYNNSYDLGVVSYGPTSTIVNATSILFDNPLGNFTNYTNVSFNDLVTNTNWQSFSWSSKPGTLPQTDISFQQKYLKIIGNNTVDSITWQWQPAELTGYNESLFEIRSYNISGWLSTGATLNTVTHTLSATNLAPTGTFAVLQYLACPAPITVAGTYNLSTNVFGAPNIINGNFACIAISASNVVFDCLGNSIMNNDSLTSNPVGIYVFNANNVTVKNCRVANYFYGNYNYNANSSRLQNIVGFNDSKQSLVLSYSNFDNITNCTGSLSYNASDSDDVYLYYSNNNIIANSTGYSTNAAGFYVQTGNGNAFVNDTAYNNNVQGFGIYASNNTVFSSDRSYNNQTYGFRIDGGSINTTLLNNSAYSNINGAGIYVSTSTLSNITSNSVYNNTNEGIYLSIASNNYLANNLVYNDSSSGIELSSSTNNLLFNNTASNGSYAGFTLTGSSLNNFTSNTACNNTRMGFYVSSGDLNNIFANNTACDNYGIFSSEGFDFETGSNSNVVANNTIYNNTYGINVAYAGNNTFINDTVFNSSVGGFYTAYFSNSSLIGGHFYNNPEDIIIQSSTSPTTLNLSNVIIDRPAGDMQNFTNLSINDTIDVNSGYSINWTSDSVPGNYKSFLGKFINISNLYPTPTSIDHIVWSWTPAEVTASGLTEPMFVLLKDNGTWTDTGATLSLASHTLSLNAMNPGSNYGIAQNVNCPVITTSGTTYTMAGNFTGAPNAAVVGYNACVVINAPNVVFDCAGYGITGNSSGSTIAIMVNSTGNGAIIKNCPAISNYSYAFYTSSASNLSITNSTAFNISQDGFHIAGGSNINVTNDVAKNSPSAGGFDAAGGSGIIFGNDSAYNMSEGFRTQTNSVQIVNNTVSNASAFAIISSMSSQDNITGNTVTMSHFGIEGSMGADLLILNNTVMNNTNGINLVLVNSSVVSNNAVSNTTQDGIELSSCMFDNVTNNSAYGSFVSGFWVTGSSGNNILSNSAYNNSNDGITVIYGSNNNTIASNLAYGNFLTGVDVIHSCDNNTVVNNTANGNLHYAGIIIYEANYSLVANNTVYNNSQGIYLWEYSYFNRIANNTVYNNTLLSGYGGITINANSSWNSITGNTVYNNPTYGIGIYGGYSPSDGNNVSGNVAYNNTYDYYVYNSSQNTFTNNSAMGSMSTAGFYALNSTGNGMFNNTANKTNIGFYLDGSNGTDMSGNFASQGTTGYYLTGSDDNSLYWNNASFGSQHGFYLLGSDSNVLSENYANSNSYNGYLVDSSSYNNLTANIAWMDGLSGSDDGFSIFDTSDNNTLSGNFALSGDRDGFSLNGASGNVLSDNTAIGNSRYGYYLYYSDGNTLSGNNVSNDNTGFDISQSNANTLSGNIAHDNPASNIYLDNSDSNNLTANTVYNGASDNSFFVNGSGNNITGNTEHNTVGDAGMWLAGDSNIVSGNTFLNNGDEGVSVDGNGNTLAGNNASNNAWAGFAVYGADNILSGDSADNNSGMSPSYGFMVFANGTTMANDTAAGNGIGFSVSQGINTLSGDKASGNTQYGILIQDAPLASLAGEHYYNNGVDMEVQSTGMPFPYTLSGVVFDEPAGDMQNFTTITLQDNVKLSSSYLLSWSPQPATPPAKDFAGKYLRISNLTPNVSIGSVTWQWSPSELTNYTESQFVLVRYDTSWSVVASNPNQTTHSMTAANLSPSSVYAIFQEPVPVTTPVVQPVVESPLSVDLTPNCTGNIVTVTSGGDISGAQVSIDNADNLADVASGMTNSDGRFVFQACGMRVRIRASHDGYQSADITLQTVDCQLCVECVTNANCADTDICANQKCVPLNCGGCSYPSDHQCVSYQCCSDSDCKGNETCVGHACKLPEKTFECYSDKDCAGNQQCLIQLGDKGGKCQNLTGCGLIQNHTITPYQCGSAPGCPACGYGQTCTDNACLTIGLKSPSTGFVGDKAPVQATQGNASCANCDLQITDPMGKVLTGMTDSAGNFSLPLLTIGEYKVAYIQNGTVIKVVEINALPKAPPPSGENPPTAAGGGAAGTAVFAVIGLLVLIIAGLVLMRRGKGGKAKGTPKAANPK